MTTLGSDIYPTTTGGEIVSVAILIVGIGFVALLTGAIAQRFLGPEIAEVEAELEAETLSAEAIALRELRACASRSPALEIASSASSAQRTPALASTHVEAGSVFGVAAGATLRPRLHSSRRGRAGW
jgi:hypothetical protein